MPHRMDVELTSARGDGTWTWRAAGAKEPRGVVDGSLLPEGARVGDVLRVEASMGLDGISIMAVLPPKERQRPDGQRLEVLGPPPPPRPPRGVGAPGPPAEGRRRAPRRGGPEGGGRPPKERRGQEQPVAEAGRGRARDTAKAPARSERSPRPEKPRPEKPRPEKPDAPARPKRLHPGHAHRSAAVAALRPEQRPIAEQLLRGGIPAVRRALEAQNAELRKHGQPEVKAEPLVALAEELLLTLKAAEWRDRAEAAAKVVEDISLRDLRSVVAGADAGARDDEARLLASTLRQALERRVSEERDRWLGQIGSALDVGRPVRALRLSARPPDVASRLPAELALRLGEAAGAAMAPDTTAERWAAVLEAVLDSPVRRSVKPAGLPADAGEDLLQLARRAAGRVPALAPLLGIEMPPPPGPRRPVPPPRRPRRPEPGPAMAAMGRAPAGGRSPRRPQPAEADTPTIDQ